MKLIKPFSCRIFVAAILLGLYVGAVNAEPPKVSNIYVPLQATVALSNDEVVNFAGQVHVLTRVSFSDTFVPAVQMYVNLIGVRGTSSAGNNYLLVGAANAEWIGLNPGPPDIPEQTFNFGLVQTNPGPPDTPPNPIVPPSPIVPVYLRDFAFIQEAGHEGTLTDVVASFSAR